MPTIAEVRQKFPQYSDLSDDQLASALHKKFYADMPEEQFKAKIGMPAKKSQPVQRAQTTADKWRDTGRALATGAGGIIGGVLAAPEAGVAAIPTLGIGGIATEAAGVGLGAGLGGQLYDWATQQSGVAPRTTLTEQAKRAAMDVPEGAAGVMGGRVLEAGLGGAVSAGKNALKGAVKPVVREPWESETFEINPQHVTGMESDGIYLTPGRKAGGSLARAEQRAKSNPFVSQAIRQEEDRSVRSMNVAAYNKVLEPLGIKYTGKVGREGIANLQQILSNQYEKIIPKIRVRADNEFVHDLNMIRAGGAELPPAQEKQLEAIINGRVLKRLKPGDQIDGQTFKDIESQLGHLSRIYKRSGDTAQQLLGDELSNVQMALRSAAERHSNPAVKDALRATNKSYAMLTRVEEASARRLNSEGIFSTGDLLSEVKRQAGGVRHKVYAAGDALLQPFAERNHTVMRDLVPDSGTAERSTAKGVGGLFNNFVVAPTTNALASQMLRRGVKTSPRPNVNALPVTTQAAGQILPPSRQQ